MVAVDHLLGSQPCEELRNAISVPIKIPPTFTMANRCNAGDACFNFRIEVAGDQHFDNVESEGNRDNRVADFVCRDVADVLFRPTLPLRQRTQHMLDVNRRRVAPGDTPGIACAALKVSARHSCRPQFKDAQVWQFDAEVLFEDRNPRIGIRKRNFDVSIKPSRAAQCRVDARRIVCRPDNDDALSLDRAVHALEQSVHNAAHPLVRPAMTNRASGNEIIDLVDQDHSRRMHAGLVECLAHRPDEIALVPLPGPDPGCVTADDQMGVEALCERCRERRLATSRWSAQEDSVIDVTPADDAVAPVLQVAGEFKPPVLCISIAEHFRQGTDIGNAAVRRLLRRLFLLCFPVFRGGQRLDMQAIGFGDRTVRGDGDPTATPRKLDKENCVVPGDLTPTPRGCQDDEIDVQLCTDHTVGKQDGGMLRLLLIHEENRACGSVQAAVDAVLPRISVASTS